MMKQTGCHIDSLDTLKKFQLPGYNQPKKVSGTR